MFDAPFVLHGREVTVRSSMGIATLRRGDETADELLRNAAVANYRAKRMGPGRCELFDPPVAAA